MILYERPSGMVCIGQAAHAWVSGRLARHWGNDSFARPEPFEGVCLGATQHDVGMTDWDRRPELDEETGYPQNFLNMDQNLHLDLWKDAPARVITQSPYAALLVSMHGHALFKGKPDRPGVQEYLDDQERYQDELIKALGDTHDNARRNQLLVWAVDYLALGAVTGWTPATVPAPDHDITCDERSPLHLTVDPWPFDVPEITIGYDARELPETSSTQEELDERLRTADWTTVDVTWSPA
jgi:hypothetical protein